MKESCVFFKNVHEAIESIPDPVTRAAAYNTILSYAMDSIEPSADCPTEVKIILSMSKPFIDKANNRYLSRVENGRKGGRPRQNQKDDEIMVEKDENLATRGENNLNDGENHANNVDDVVENAENCSNDDEKRSKDDKKRKKQSKSAKKGAKTRIKAEKSQVQPTQVVDVGAFLKELKEIDKRSQAECENKIKAMVEKELNYEYVNVDEIEDDKIKNFLRTISQKFPNIKINVKPTKIDHIDIDKLIDAIEHSKFLQQAPLSFILDNRIKAVAGKYMTFFAQQENKPNFKEHFYSKEQLNSLFDSLDSIEV